MEVFKKRLNSSEKRKMSKDKVNKKKVEIDFHAELEKLMLKYEVVEIRSSLFMPYK